MNFQRLKIELEGLKTSVQHMFNDHNEELNKYIIEQVNSTLTEEWVKESVKKQVNICVQNAVNDISENWALQSAIKNVIGDHVAGLINQSQKTKEEPQ